MVSNKHSYMVYSCGRCDDDDESTMIRQMMRMIMMTMMLIEECKSDIVNWTFSYI